MHRDELVARVRRRITGEGLARTQLFVIIAFAGLVALLLSATALHVGLSSMAIRYGLSVAGGYLSFLLLVRVWIAWKRGRVSLDLDPALDLLDVVDRPRASSSPHLAFEGGHSGGAGASGEWTTASSFRSSGSSARPSGGGGWGLDLDGDVLLPLIIAVVCATGGVLAIAYVVYGAPLLLAEVAVDAAVVGALYGRLKREDMSHWTATVIRRTWIPALTLALFAAAAGYVLQVAVPDARSIGAVISALGDR